MAPIRLGDGTSISPQGYQEVRKGDGTVLWSAEPTIPDEGDLHYHYDATALDLSDGDSVSTWPGVVGPDLTGQGGPTYVEGAQNGNAVVRYDGVDDAHTTTFNSTYSQPNHVFFAFKRNTSYPNTSPYYLSTASDSARQDFNSGQDNYWAIWGPNGLALQSSTPDEQWHVVSLLFDGANSEIRLDGGAETVTGDAGSHDYASLAIGFLQWNGDRWTNMDVGELAHYPMDKSSSIDEIESYLMGKWL